MKRRNLLFGLLSAPLALIGMRSAVEETTIQSVGAVDVVTPTHGFVHGDKIRFVRGPYHTFTGYTRTWTIAPGVYKDDTEA